MKSLHEETIACPYCGESIVVLVDPEDVGQEYIEDCQVCCRPISFVIGSDFDGELSVYVQSENDV